MSAWYKDKYPVDLISGLYKTCEELGIRPVFTSIVGSRLHGNATKSSDWDARIVYVHADQGRYFNMKPHDSAMTFSPSKMIGDASVDVAALEYRKFVDILKHASPNALEQVYSTMRIDGMTMPEAAAALEILADASLNPVSLLYSFLGFARSCKASLDRSEGFGVPTPIKRIKKKLFHIQRLYCMAKYVYDKAADGQVVFSPVSYRECMDAVGNPFSDVGLAIDLQDRDSLAALKDDVYNTRIPEMESMASASRDMPIILDDITAFDMDEINRVYLKAATGNVDYGKEGEALRDWLDGQIDRRMV